MALTLSTAARNASVDAVTSLITSLRLYTGSIPADCGAVDVGNTLIAEFTLSPGTFVAAIDGSSTLADTISTVAIGSGDIAWGRFMYSGGVLFDCTAGTGASDLIFDNLTVAAGQTVAVTSGTYTQPAS